MVSGSRIEGGSQILAAGVRRTIQSIREVVGNHSDADIYVTLKEENMDPNETIQKLLNQDPFHEVKSKRDRRKENSVNKSFVAAEPRKNPEIVHVPLKYNTYPDQNVRRSVSGRNASYWLKEFMRASYIYPRILSTMDKDNHDIGSSQEFRVVRDNRVNQNAATDSKSSQNSISKKNERVNSDGFLNSISYATRGHHQEPPVGQHSSLPLKGPDTQPKKTKDITSGGNDRKEVLEERCTSVLNATSRAQMKANGSQQHPTNSSSSPVVGVYSSSSDPIHVPSLHSRPASNVGAIRREVGVVGPRRLSSDNSAKQPPSTSSSNSQSGRVVHTRESARPLSSDQSSKNMTSESLLPGLPANRSSSSSQYGSRPHQLTGNQKAPMPNMEWKPKSIVKPSVNGPGVIRSPAKAVSPPADKSEASSKEATVLQGSLSQLDLSENQNVILAPHIRVSETDRCRITFGSLETELGGSVNLTSATSAGADKLSAEPSRSDSVSELESSGAEPTVSKQLDSVDESIRNFGSNLLESVVVSDNQLTEKIESSSSHNLDNYAGGLIQNNSPPYTPEQLHQQENESPNFSGYEQMGYDMSYLRPIVDDTVRVPGIPSSQEILNTHATNAFPASTIAMAQHQQQQLAQMYPQLHVSHFPNLMQYRQYLSPVYPMPVPGYSNNPAYHPSNGNSFLLLPGSNSHLTPSGTVKYGVQQFKPMPAGSQNGFANFTNPTGYAINTPGIVGSATGHEDSSRLKYKDSLYVPNPQAETSEIWMNPRDLPSLQSASYYNMQGQTPHPAYLTSHSGHASFNAAAAAAQSSHMQYTAMYHPTAQQAAIASPHLGPTMGANVGVGVAGPAHGAQVGAYQQTPLGHLNWTGNY